MREIDALDAPATVDELPPLVDLVVSLATVDEDEELDDAVSLEEIKLTTWIELDVTETDGGDPRVTASTPTQWTETTVMPVFHRLGMRITRDADA